MKFKTINETVDQDGVLWPESAKKTLIHKEIETIKSKEHGNGEIIIKRTKRIITDGKHAIQLELKL